MIGRPGAETVAVVPGVPSIRSRLAALVGLFAAALLFAFGAALWIGTALHPAPTARSVIVYGLVAVAFGGLVVVAVIPFLFQRPLVEAWALGGVDPARRQTVRRAVWSNQPESLEPTELADARHFARIFVQNTPHRLLQSVLLLVVIVAAVAAQLVLGSTHLLLISVVYPVVLVLFVGSGILRRRRQTLGAEAFLLSAPAPE